MTIQNALTNFHVHTLLRAKDWQARPEYDHVCEWWNNGGHGVCALVGLGGAGKTAIAEQFLHSLRDSCPKTDRTPQESQKPRTPPAVFVYSFYDDDKPANFLERLQMWLERNARIEDQLSIAQIMFLVQNTQGLMVLDGLEKLQEPNDRGFGKIISPQVRELLDHIASGACNKLSVLLTSRFPLTDLRDSDRRFYHAITISRISVPAGIGLLRDRGVRGSDPQLTKIVLDCGQHALTIDLAGGFIAEFGDGDPGTDLELNSPAKLKSEIEDEIDPTRRAVLKQGLRFLAIAERYRQAMRERDEASLALLERICMFSLGARFSLIKEIFTGSGKETISGESLAKLEPTELRRKLDWLVGLKIVERNENRSLNEDSTKDITYTVHPAVRDSFVQGIADHQKSILHEAIGQGIALTLGQRPGNEPSDKPTLDLLEEIAFHTLQNGRVTDAWNIYQDRMGGCHNLLAELNDYERTERITGAILRQHESRPNGLSKHDEVILLSDHGYASLELGKTAQAEEVLTRGLQLSRKLRSNVETLTGNLSYVLYQRGKLTSLCEEMFASLPLLRQTERQLSYLQELVETDAIQGRIKTTIDPRDYGIEVDDELAKKLPLTFVCDETILPSIEKSKCELDNEKRRHSRGHRSVAVAELQFAEALIANEQFEQARTQVARAFKWANAHDASGIRCWGELLSVRIELAEWRCIASDEEIRSLPNEKLDKASCYLEAGLRTARNSGYSLLHIELILEKAKLALLSGDPQSAVQLADIAIKIGVEEDSDTGQLQLFAASDEQCHHAWSIPVGLQIEAEAKLLQAANLLGRTNWTILDEVLPASDRTSVEDSTSRARALIEEAKSKLSECLEYWYSLRDPTQGSRHNLTIGEREYCYRAADANAVLQDLRNGILTRNPLAVTNQKSLANDLSNVLPISSEAAPMTHAESLKAFVLELQRYDASFSASVDDFDDDEFVVGVDHDLNIAAAQLATFYPSQKLPVAPRHAFRQFLRLAGWQPTWESVEKAIDELTTWAEGELVDIESANQIASKLDRESLLSGRTQQDSLRPRRFAIALSFPGEHRGAVSTIAKELAKTFGKDRVFYDKWYEPELVGPDFDRALSGMYKDAEIVVPFFSKFYEKPWCELEWRTIRGILLERRRERSVIPVHFDDTAIPGWSPVDLGIKLRGRSLKDIASVISESHVQRFTAAGIPCAASLKSNLLYHLLGSKTPGVLSDPAETKTERRSTVEKTFIELHVAGIVEAAIVFSVIMAGLYLVSLLSPLRNWEGFDYSDDFVVLTSVCLSVAMGFWSNLEHWFEKLLASICAIAMSFLVMIVVLASLDTASVSRALEPSVMSAGFFMSLTQGFGWQVGHFLKITGGRSSTDRSILWLVLTGFLVCLAIALTRTMPTEAVVSR